MEFRGYYGKHKTHNKTVSQKSVRQKVKFDFRDDMEKKNKIVEYAEATGTTFSDLMRQATNNLIESINEAEISDI